MIRIPPLVVVRNLSELHEDWAAEPLHYWAEFENVFGERFRTRNPCDPQRPAEFEPLAAIPAEGDGQGASETGAPVGRAYGPGYDYWPGWGC